MALFGLELNDFRGFSGFLPLTLALPFLPALHSIVVDQPDWVNTCSRESTRYSPSGLSLSPCALFIRSANRSERPGISSRTPAFERLNAFRRALAAFTNGGLTPPVRKDVPVRFRLRAPNKSRACMRFFVQAFVFLFRNSESCSAIICFRPYPGVLPTYRKAKTYHRSQPPSTLFKLDLLSANKNGTPTTGSRCFSGLMPSLDVISREFWVCPNCFQARA